MNQILVEGINLYAYHGCLDAEGQIGANYVVDVTMDTNFDVAAKEDDLEKTIDYVIVYEIVKRQMAIRSKLIECVGQRIVDEMKNTFPTLHALQVKIVKINPPMNGNVDRVSVIVKG